MKIMRRNLGNHMNRSVSVSFLSSEQVVLILFHIISRLLSPGALELSEALLSMDPSKRPTAAQALEFNYFKSELPEPVMPAK